MKAVYVYLLPLLGALSVLAEEKCQCPQVKCPGEPAADLCKCLNSREAMCKERCPKYQPTFRPCPISPPSTLLPTPTGKPEPCTCEPTFCAQVWPQSCYCANAVKQRCFEKCGGPKPEYQTCPPLDTPSFVTVPSPTKTLKPTPNPSPKNKLCGGGRGNYFQCSEGYTCIKDPRRPGCGPECDGYGICVKDKLCGGFAAFTCPEKEQVCVDDPRDDCDPKKGGADCGGLCAYKETESPEEAQDRVSK